MNALIQPHVVCRPALPSDSKDVLEFTKFIWEGHDYIKYVWRDWLADPQGMLAAAVYGPKTVGIAKITLLSPGQWWMEGFRVDPSYQGLGVGSHLHEYMDRWWLEHGNGMLRLMTSSERVQVHHLAGRTGFRKVGEAWAYRAPAADMPQQAFEAVSDEEIAVAAEFGRKNLAGPTQLMDMGWRFAALDAAALRSLGQKGRLLWWQRREGLAGFWEDDDEDGPVLAISFLACKSTSLAPLLKAVTHLAAADGYKSVLWLAPNDPGLQSVLTSAGYASEWDHAGFLYEKSHP